MLAGLFAAGSPLPHRTTAVTALTTGRSGLDLLKDPGGGACPLLAAWLADGVGFRLVALERETKGKVLVPTPTRQPPAPVPSPSGPRAGSRGPPGPGGTGSGRVGVPRGFWWQNILDWWGGGSRGHPLSPSPLSRAHPAAGAGG